MTLMFSALILLKSEIQGAAAIWNNSGWLKLMRNIHVLTKSLPLSSADRACSRMQSSSRSILTSGQTGRPSRLKSGPLKSFSAGKLMTKRSCLVLLCAKHSRIVTKAEVSSIRRLLSPDQSVQPMFCILSQWTSQSDIRKEPKILTEPSTTARFGMDNDVLERTRVSGESLRNRMVWTFGQS